MTKLGQIKKTAQYVVSAIASAMEMDVAFIDENFNLVATSKTFLKKRGTNINKEFVRGVIKNKVMILSNPGFNELCKGCVYEGNCPETAELIRTIEYDNKIIGVILMIAYTQKQKDKLLGNTDGLLDFIGEMASLVCNEIKLNQLLKKEKIIQNQLNALINFMDTGIITIDAKGVITQVNAHANELLRLKEEATTQLLENYLSKNDFLPLLDGKIIVRQETDPILNMSNQCLLSGRPVEVEQQIVGAIISLENIKKMRSVVYDYSEKQMETTLDDIHGSSSDIIKIKEYANLLATNDSTVLIQGESGTGKELFARSIHYGSQRVISPFIPINCAAIPEALLESELFGYDEGAFSGAKKGGKPGKFEIASGGTIFLDEIGDMPLHMQAKLLRVLQDKRVERVGGVKSMGVDVRVIAATNQDLLKMQKKGEFREDLYFRLNVMPLSIPPLRARREDIMVLSNYFLKKYSKNFNLKIKGYSKEAEQVLMAYHWPGNARELQNAIEYATNVEKTECITLESLPDSISAGNPLKKYKTLADKIKYFEISMIQNTIKYHGTSVEAKEKAAKELGISLPTLYRKLQTAR